MLLVAAEVAPAMDACSTDTSLGRGHGEEVTGWEAAAGAIPTSQPLQVRAETSSAEITAGLG